MRATKVMRSAANSSLASRGKRNRYCDGSVTFHCTVHSTEAVFRSPVSIRVSSSWCRWVVERSRRRETSAPKGRRRPCSSTLTFITWSIIGSLKCSPGMVVAWYLPNRSTTACSCGSTVYDESKISPSRSSRPMAQGMSGINRLPGLARPAAWRDPACVFLEGFHASIAFGTRREGEAFVLPGLSAALGGSTPCGRIGQVRLT